MTQEQIHQLFKQGYNQANWKQFLGETFTKPRLLATPETLTGIDGNVASKALKLGYVSLDENGIERQIAVYEVALAKGIILERNRVGLRNLLRKYWKNIDAAFIVYHNPENKKWRFTYVSELTGYDAEGEFIKIKTEPKRYTYVLGEGESTRTAAERFAMIAKRANKVKLDDVKDAFSVEKLSKAFFDEYKNHYDLFCQFMMKKPGIKASIFNGDEKAIRDFNKKLLGRIVFLYFIQKKGWMGVPVGSKWGQGDFNFLTNLFKQHKNPDLFYSEMLTRLFFDTLNTKRKDDIIELVKGQPCRIPYLNGGLFEEDDKKQRNIILNATLFENLFEFFSQYNFTIYEDDPNDHTVAVDPEMLGHIFENLLEDNKDKGAFYTPKEIVHYMCQESLIEYLTTWFENKGYEVTGYIGFDKPDQPRLFSANEGRKGQMVLETTPQIKGKQIDRLLIEKLLKKKLDDQDKKLVKQHVAEFRKALDNVKICDPAIGSGAFPMGLLQEMFTAKQTLWHFEHGNLVDFPASDVKLNIIQNSIYGVDIEKGAVDIARLRFWLSLVVDEETPKALPNLDYKIVVGNSLVSKLGDDIIDIDWNLNETSHGLFGADLAKHKGELLKLISAEQKEFFNPDSDKKKLAADIRKLKIDLLINQLELMITTKGIETKPNGTGKKLAEQTELYLQTLGWKDSIKQLKKLKDEPEKPLNYFDWKLDFPEVLNESVNSNAGFDIVIANPPFGAKLDEDIKTVLKNRFDYLHTRTIDSYNFFIGIGSNLLKNDGVLTYIIPSAYLFQIEFEKSRGYFMNNFSPKIFLNLGENIFQAVVPSCIFSFIKSNVKSQVYIGESKDRSNGIIDFSNGIHMSKKELLEFGNSTIPFNFKNQSIIKKIQLRCSRTLGEVCLEVNSGITTGHKTAYIIPKSKAIDLKIEKDVMFPTLEGRNLSPFSIKYDNKVILYIDKEFKPSNNPNTIIYLKEYYDELANRSEVLQGIKDWYSLGRARGQNLLAPPKIMCRETGDSIISCFDDFGYYPMNTVICIKLNSTSNEFYKSVCCLLNSTLINFIFKSISQEEGRTFAKVRPINLRKLPLPNFTDRQICLLSDKYEKIINDDNNKLELIKNLNNIVYRLYELSYDEVKVIDPVFPLSKKEYESIEL